jgi:hypothetical protein
MLTGEHGLRQSRASQLCQEDNIKLDFIKNYCKEMNCTKLAPDRIHLQASEMVLLIFQFYYLRIITFLRFSISSRSFTAWNEIVWGD